MKPKRKEELELYHIIKRATKQLKRLCDAVDEEGNPLEPIDPIECKEVIYAEFDGLTRRKGGVIGIRCIGHQGFNKSYCIPKEDDIFGRWEAVNVRLSDIWVDVWSIENHPDRDLTKGYDKTTVEALAHERLHAEDWTDNGQVDREHQEIYDQDDRILALLGASSVSWSRTCVSPIQVVLSAMGWRHEFVPDGHCIIKKSSLVIETLV